eukprot:CAMPEP_0182877634 /NCGR_PEP_ID=MMETSP0034_2-20130328/14867_1 /TAXON_ID=156128 /ORGANISM="Nephroselmis pyriformis, Strain CCMP717" /LENGTH=777 /DNA_ID=CAMNT_0025010485 /DNA_START=163 /DNA_END=2493 /DNA_ORIENTATION=-
MTSRQAAIRSQKGGGNQWQGGAGTPTTSGSKYRLPSLEEARGGGMHRAKVIPMGQEDRTMGESVDQERVMTEQEQDESDHSGMRSFQKFKAGTIKLRDAAVAAPANFKEMRVRQKNRALARDEKSWFFSFWDPYTILLLIYTAVVTPYDVAFLETSVDPLFFINRIVDVSFLFDMYLSFTSPHMQKDGVWVYKWQVIAVGYLKSWFIVDLFSVFPFDVVYVLTNSNAAANLKLLRLMRLFRLAKLLRVLRAGRLFRRWESAMAVNYAQIHLCKYMGFVILIAHWLACAWYVIKEVEDNDQNWVSNYAFVEEDSSSGALYLACLHWAVATLSTVGYGDIIPTSEYERLYAIFVTIVAASLYAYMIGNVCSVVAQMDEGNSMFYHMMDTLNKFMKEKELPQHLRSRLRDFFRFARSTQSIQQWHGLYDQMSPALKAEVQQNVHSRTLRSLKCFEGAGTDFMTEVSLHLRSEIYTAYESIFGAGDFAEELYIIGKGMVVVKGVIMGKGKSFGEDMVFRERRRTYSAITVSQARTFILSRRDLIAILEYHPVERQMLRKFAVRVIFREAVMQYTATVRALQDPRMAGIILRGRNLGSEGEAPTLEEIHSLSVDMSDVAAVLPIVNFFRPAVVKQNRTIETALSEIEKAAIVIQRFARRRFLRNRLAMVVNYKRGMLVGEKDPRLVGFLERYMQLQHLKLLDAERLTFDQLLKLSPEGLRQVGMPLGDACRLLDSAKEYSTTLESKLRTSVHRVGDSARKQGCARFGGGGVLPALPGPTPRF